MADIIEVRDLVKRYGENVAVDGVTFSIQEGETFGLLGPNGAGKTTIISVVCCLLAPNGGDVFVDGASVRTDPQRVKRSLGVVPQDIALYPTLTALENLRFWGRMYGLSGKTLDARVGEALEVAGLTDRAKERIEAYSGGMKRRVNIAAGMLHHPRVLLMDEPTVGIDPQSRNHILETVRRLAEAGTTVVYTSHYMEEVEAICDRVAIVDHGKVIGQGTVAELQQLIGDENAIMLRVEEVPDETLASLRAVPGVDRVTFADGALEVLARDTAAVLSPVVSALDASGARASSIDIVEPNLETVFLHLTGKSLRD